MNRDFITRFLSDSAQYLGLGADGALDDPIGYGRFAAGRSPAFVGGAADEAAPVSLLPALNVHGCASLACGGPI